MDWQLSVYSTNVSFVYNTHAPAQPPQDLTRTDNQVMQGTCTLYDGETSSLYLWRIRC